MTAACSAFMPGPPCSGSLEEEVSLRMHEVQQAVHDAEAEEQASGRDDSTGGAGRPDGRSGRA